MTDVIIPTHNNLDALRSCLAALARQRVQPRRIFVCVDGSTDGTVEALAAVDSAELVVLLHPGNAHRGRAATRNLALPYLEGGQVLFLDSDMTLVPDALEAHLALARQGVVSVGAIDYLNARENIWAGYLMRRGRNRYADGATLPFTQYTTANSMVAAEAVIAIGGFDERFVGYGGEDVDFAIRLERSAGMAFLNNRRAVARTSEPKTWQMAMRQFEAFGATNLRLLTQLHPDAPPTFELGRRSSRRPVDRLFVALLNPIVAGVVRWLVQVGPRSLTFRLLNYEVIAAVHRGYLAGTRS